MKLKIRNISGDLENPKYSNPNDVGMDLRANIPSTITLLPFRRVLIPTGICIELPNQYQAEVRSRSGLTVNHGVFVLGGVGTIDPSYKDEIGVVLMNLGTEAFEIKRGDRVGQLVVSKFESVELVEVEELEGEDRGGGWGSTGIE